MAEDKWKLGQVATQTQNVFVKDDKTYTLDEVLLVLLNQNERILELLK